MIPAGGQPDPVEPLVTFDNYIIPDTVRETRRGGPLRSATGGPGRTVLFGGICFFLGAVTAVQFLWPRPPEVAAESTVDPLAEAVAAATQETVSRTQPADLLAPMPQDDTLNSTVMAGLKPQPAPAAADPATPDRQDRAVVSRNVLAQLRAAVLAGNYVVTATERDGQKRLALQTLDPDLPHENLGKQLREAVIAGDIAIPASLSTVEGNADIDTFLFNLIQTSLAEDGTPQGAEAAREMSRRAFAASGARTQKEKGQRFYTVERGDSLAYISLQFYGRPGAYLRIFEANGNQLRSPDLIKVGQRLIIPE